MKKTILLTTLALLGIFQAFAQENECLLLVREGVKWVNEKVIIDHGDTTSYYYTYEFSGYDLEEPDCNGIFYNACYYYTGESLDVERDSLIASLRNYSLENHKDFYYVYSYRNHAYDKILNEQRPLLPPLRYGEISTLYRFGIDNEYDYDTTIGFYLLLQTFFIDMDPPLIMTSDNFIEVVPVEIEGVSCHRYAYINEQGEPQCYVVEGIGFDSYDMGDLLTPFTRKPDPDADYQEWCGLSHVIKDGKIIYKGMRYREDAFDDIDEVADGQGLKADGNYYDLMGRAVGKDVPTTPGIYIHQGKKIVIR